MKSYASSFAFALYFTLFPECLGANFEVRVITGNSFGAGTDANVQIKLIGTKGSTSAHYLVGSGDPFERGNTDTFSFQDNAEIGQITAIEIYRDEAGWFSGWELARVIVKMIPNRKWSLFEFNQWTDPDEWFTIQLKCEPGFQSNPSTGLCEGPNCGSRPNSRISGGTVAPPGSWPWQAMLRFTTYDRPIFCGGSLILPQWVLTTAYCVYGKKVPDIFVRLGADQRDTTTGSEQDITVENVFIHPNYHRPNLFSNDAALIKLKKPASLSNGVGLVCLPSEEMPSQISDPSTPLWVTGWGYISLPAGTLPQKLKQAQIHIASRATCKADHPTRIIDESMLCAGSNISKASPCQGDTGGPLAKQVQGKWYLEGAFSWGADCDPSKPYKHQMYTNISHVRDWIANTIADNQYT